jgi:hypothetical protein
MGGGGSNTEDGSSDIAPSSGLFGPVGGLDSACVEG